LNDFYYIVNFLYVTTNYYRDLKKI
jgi:hypothetical protein